MRTSKMIRVIHPYTPAMLNFLESWLMQKAADGWRLEEVCGWKFIFRGCKPYNTKYFAYSGFGTGTGISNEYWSSKSRYSLSKSTINKQNTFLYEVDVAKIDADFKCYISLRNKFYLKHYIGLLIYSMVYIIFLSLAVQRHLPHIYAIFFYAIGATVCAYSLLSVFCLLVKQK